MNLTRAKLGWLNYWFGVALNHSVRAIFKGEQKEQLPWGQSLLGSPKILPLESAVLELPGGQDSRNGALVLRVWGPFPPLYIQAGGQNIRQ